MEQDHFTFFASAYIVFLGILFAYNWKLHCQLKKLEKKIGELKK